MTMAQSSAIGSSWSGSPFLPLHQPLMQMPFARPRAIRLGMSDNLPPMLERRFTKEQLHSLLAQFPETYESLTKQQNNFPSRLREKYPKSTTTTTIPMTTTTTTTSTPSTEPLILPRRQRPQREDVPKFHYGGIEGREDYAVGPAEDDAVVLLVGLFNLLAIVVYAASKYVTGDREGLSDRVIQWQVQKVLDELVIKVHSSQYVANLLSRAMPNDASVFQVGRNVVTSNDSRPFWLYILKEHLKSSSWKNFSREATTEWMSKLKDQLMTEIGSSPAAISTVRLHPQIYKPLKDIYSTVTSEDGVMSMVENFLANGGETGRSLVNIEDIPGLLNTFSKLSLNQIQSLLATLTALGRAQQRVNIIPALAAALGATNWIESNPEGYNPAESGRVISEGDSYVDVITQMLSQTYRQPRRPDPYARRNNPQENINRGYYKSRYSRLIESVIDTKTSEETEDHTSLPETSNESPRRNRPTQLVKRQGLVEDESSVASTGHWTDRWFSLVTQLSPVGLDITTLYARARARPTCLRALLCRANNAWRQVGPVQASLTPFTSVLVSWLLEDTMPHSLGDSLIAIRAGWMGKDCSVLYPECPLQPDPHPAAKEAITFFSRLQFAATGPQSDASDNKPTTSDAQHDSAIADRIDSSLEMPIKLHETSYPSRVNSPPITSIPNHNYRQPDDHPMATNSPRPAHNYRLPENERPIFPNTRHPTYVHDEHENYNAAELHAYYNRYKGQGPMAVPGSQYSSKYGQFDDERGSENDYNNQLYEKYDSPSISSAEGEISGSNSVSGMALQDRPTGNNVKVWEELFKAGLYGANVPQSALNKMDESSDSVPEKSTRLQKPLKRPIMTSLNKIGALMPDQPGFYNNPGYSSFHTKPNDNNNQGASKPRPNRPARPYFNLGQLQKRQQTTGIPAKAPQVSSAIPFVKKYKFGLRRGLPASNVNGYNAYISSNNNLYQRQKPWYAYISPPRHRATPPTPNTTPKTTPTTTTVNTTANPLAVKDIAPFGPEDAVTDVLRNELLYEYIRDRQGSIPIDDKRSLS